MARLMCPYCAAEIELDAPGGTEFDCGACGGVSVMPHLASHEPAGGDAAALGTPASASAAAGATARPPAPRSSGPPRGGVAAAEIAEEATARRTRRLVAAAWIVTAACGAVAAKIATSDAYAPASPPPVGADSRPSTTPPLGAPGDGPTSRAASRPTSRPLGAPSAGERRPTSRPRRRGPRPNDLVDPLGALRWDAADPEADADVFVALSAALTRTAAELETEGGVAEAEKLRAEALRATDAALALEPDHAVARDQRGFVLFDRAAAERMLEATWMRPHFRAELAEAIPDVHREVGEPSGPKWLDCTQGAGRDAAIRWRALMRRAERRRGQANDAEVRFAAGVKRRHDDLENEFRGRLRRRPEDDAIFEVHVYRPYVLFIQGDPNVDGDRIAERWIELLDQVKDTFFLRYRRRLGLDPLEETTPVLVLRSFDEYRVYNASNTQNSAAHFEPATGRLVTWAGAFGKDGVADDFMDPSGMTVRYIRSSVFHEATHQLVHFATRTSGRALGNSQAMWFSEGIADYFGFHTRRFDPDAGRWTYRLGSVSAERVATLDAWRKGLMPLIDLLDYLRGDFSSDNALMFLNRRRTAEQMMASMRRTQLCYAQGWALVYYLNEYEGKKYRDRFDAYFKAERIGQSGPSVFRRIFGADLDPIEKGYLAMIDAFIEARREGRIENGEIRPK